jgi:hypothetical protein
MWVGELESGGRLIVAAAEGLRRREVGMPMGAGSGVAGGFAGGGVPFRELAAGDEKERFSAENPGEPLPLRGGSTWGRSALLVVGDGVDCFLVVVGRANDAVNRLSSGIDDERKCAGSSSWSAMLWWARENRGGVKG